MNKVPTETIIQHWRYGQTQAERLCAELLLIEGFQSVDPQCPLGGPDGLKDVLCIRDGQRWIAASYFPTTRPEYKEIKEKFKHDLRGVQKNDAQGLAFFINQPLTPGNRSELITIAQPLSAEIYHLERIRALLDSPKGYGLRLEYLRIPMTEEEQLGFFSTLKEDLTERFINQEKAISELHRKMDMLMMQTSAFVEDLPRKPSSLLKRPDLESKDQLVYFPTATISISQLFWIHRLVTDDTRLPHAQRGHFRTVAVWVGPVGGTPEEARFTPPPPDEVYSRTEGLLESWREEYHSLIHSTPDKIIGELALFHHGFLSIHPFLDANGRVARAILQQQAI
jgi:arsenate reductase-like glutaredoxin family protein